MGDEEMRPVRKKGGRVEDRGPIDRKFDRSGNGDRNGLEKYIHLSSASRI